MLSCFYTKHLFIDAPFAGITNRARYSAHEYLFCKQGEYNQLYQHNDNGNQKHDE